MKKIIPVFFLMFGLAFMPFTAGAAPAQTSQITPSSAINKAGRQRMLSQRMVKFYCQIGQGVLADKAAVQMGQSVVLFESQLDELEQNAPNAEIKTAVAEMKAAWLPYREVVTAKPTLKGGDQLIDLSETLLKRAHNVTQLWQNAAGTQTGRLVNISGRQRMLSQRMARFYFEKRRGFRPAEISAGLKQAKEEFTSAMNELESAPQNTPAIRKELEQARNQWIFFNNAIDQADSKDPILATNVATSSERILEVMDKVTGMYEKL
ncbi:MAG: type IV pili methyl-accepting chemotaxis transducer N-terminal domain-containing protein [Sulfuricellaceae bacterium]|nr:type IV pili methyl-accepting chemotaxis transducer N-terminal domain-containing protein [Sulfuricellaceae bacterium]